MLFSRKNAAIVAAFLAPSAYAQTAAVVAESQTSCNTTGLATFNIGAPAGAATGGTAGPGPLNLFVTVNLNSACGTAGNGGYTIQSVSGTFGGTTNTGGALSLTTGQGASVTPDFCFYPCSSTVQTGGGLDAAGFTFQQAAAAGGTASQYRLYTTTNSAYALASATTGTATNVGTISAINNCRAPSPGAAICAATATQTCASASNGFYTFTKTDTTTNDVFDLNVAFNPASTCTQAGALAGAPVGFTITSVSGLYTPANGNQNYLALSGSGVYCFYPCQAIPLDSTGLQYSTYDPTTGAAATTGLTFRPGATAGTYTANNNIYTGSFAQSCMSSQAAYYRACASSSTSSTMSSTSSGLIASPSVSLPVTLPSVSLSGSVTPTVSISGVVTPTGSVSGSASNVVTIATGATSGAASGAASITGASSGTATVPTTTPTSGAVSATSTGPETSVATPFVITVTVRASRRRQAVEYVGSGGVLTTDPNQAAQFQLLDGQLFSNGVIVSTGPQIPAQQPLAGGVQGTVSTVWSSTNGAIAWTNAVFANGAASFCVENNVVNTVFVAAPATGCTPVALTNTPLSAIIVASPSASGAAAAGGITINNNFSPVIGVTVTVNLVLGSATLSNGTVITTTGLSSATEPLYATASNGFCVPCHLSSAGVACPSSGVVVYQTACSACAAYATPSAAIVPCPTCAPVAVATAGAAAAAGATAGAAAGAAGAGAAAGAAATAAAAAAATAGKNVFTGGAATYGVEAAAIVAAGAALLL